MTAQIRVLVILTALVFAMLWSVSPKAAQGILTQFIGGQQTTHGKQN